MFVKGAPGNNANPLTCHNSMAVETFTKFLEAPWINVGSELIIFLWIESSGIYYILEN